ncbi:MAG: hypothetical protein AAFV31_05740 [Pseudomonadota bacterium]
MARSIFYRTKAPQGPWQRATGPLPLTVTGLTNGLVYEVDTGDGAVTEITPQSVFSEVPVLADGSAYVQSANMIPDATSFLWFGSFTPSVNDRGALLSMAGVTGSIHFWEGGSGPALRSYIRCDGGALIHMGPSITTGTRCHALIRGYESGGDMIVDVQIWDAVTGAWSGLAPETRGGTKFEFTTGMSAPYRLFERNDNAGQGFEGIIYRNALWTGIGPDISQAGVQSLFTDGAEIADPSVAVASYGAPVFDIYGPAARFNGPVNGGSDASLTTQGTFIDG